MWNPVLVDAAAAHDLNHHRLQCQKDLLDPLAVELIVRLDHGSDERVDILLTHLVLDCVKGVKEAEVVHVRVGRVGRLVDYLDHQALTSARGDNMVVEWMDMRLGVVLLDEHEVGCLDVPVPQELGLNGRDDVVDQHVLRLLATDRDALDLYHAGRPVIAASFGGNLLDKRPNADLAVEPLVLGRVETRLVDRAMRLVFVGKQVDLALDLDDVELLLVDMDNVHHVAEQHRPAVDARHAPADARLGIGLGQQRLDRVCVRLEHVLANATVQRRHGHAQQYSNVPDRAAGRMWDVAQSPDVDGALLASDLVPLLLGDLDDAGHQQRHACPTPNTAGRFATDVKLERHRVDDAMLKHWHLISAFGERLTVL